jgi:hypothetical protein
LADRQGCAVENWIWGNWNLVVVEIGAGVAEAFFVKRCCSWGRRAYYAAGAPSLAAFAPMFIITAAGVYFFLPPRRKTPK